jgi:hypothetical protein
MIREPKYRRRKNVWQSFGMCMVQRRFKVEANCSVEMKFATDLLLTPFPLSTRHALCLARFLSFMAVLFFTFLIEIEMLQPFRLVTSLSMTIEEGRNCR